MPFDDLRQWIAALDRAGELKRIRTEVDPILEIAEITDRVSKMHMRNKKVGAEVSLLLRDMGTTDWTVPVAPPFSFKT